jgi:hypothetical protein
MKNSLEIQLRAVRSPRILKQADAGTPELIDIWAFHRDDHSPRAWHIAVKFGRELVEPAMTIDTGTLFTVKERLDQTRRASKDIYDTFIWAEQILEVVPPSKGRSAPAPSPELPNFPNPEADQPNPQTDNHHA